MVVRSVSYLERKRGSDLLVTASFFVVLVLVMLRAADSKIASPSIGKK